MINQLRNKTMEHETSQNLIKVELTVKQLTSILINFDYLNKLAKERGKSLIAIKYSNDIEPFKKALNYTLAEDPRQFSAEECDLLYWANKFVNDPDAVKRLMSFSHTLILLMTLSEVMADLVVLELRKWHV